MRTLKPRPAAVAPAPNRGALVGGERAGLLGGATGRGTNRGVFTASWLGLKFCGDLTASRSCELGGFSLVLAVGVAAIRPRGEEGRGFDARPLGASVMRRRCMFVGGVEGAREGATLSGCGAVRVREAALHPGSGRPVSRARGSRERPGSAGKP